MGEKKDFLKEWRHDYDQWYAAQIEGNRKPNSTKTSSKYSTANFKMINRVDLNKLQQKSLELTNEYRKNAVGSNLLIFEKLVISNKYYFNPIEIFRYKMSIFFWRGAAPSSVSPTTNRKSGKTKKIEISPSLLFIAGLIYTAKERESALGDLEEQFKKNTKKFGRRKAHFFVFRDLCESIYPTAKAALAKIFKLATFYAILKRIIS